MVKQPQKTFHFDDWIIAVKWLQQIDEKQIVILFAHNYVCIHNVNTGEQKHISCKEKCILYGGSIFDDYLKNLIIFSGTVFQEILVWQLDNSMSSKKDASILHRLIGHKGVIFSVIYDEKKRLICSTSDDRTIRLWKAVNTSNSVKDHIDWKTAKINLITTMFGHVARVWRTVISDNNIFSIGEDSLLCIWRIDGKLLKKIHAHNGAAIWSIVISKRENVIISGGANGAVHAWSFKQSQSCDTCCIPQESVNWLPKYVFFLNKDVTVILTTDGKLLHYSKNSNVLQESIDLQIFSNYCIMQVSPCRMMIALASRYGQVVIYEVTDVANEVRLQKCIETNIMECQIFSVQWLSSSTLLLCGTNGYLKTVTIKNDTLCINSKHLLPFSRERWVTTAVMHLNLLICGDRMGSIHVFKLDDCVKVEGSGIDKNTSLKEPLQSLNKIHGRLGVQSCTVIGTKLLSTGRDGTLRFYKIQDNDYDKPLHSLHAIKLPMDWGCSIIKTNNDLYVLGFKEIDFIVYSTVFRRCLVRIPCGGGHRSWDCTLNTDFLNFMYIRDKQVHLVNNNLHSLSLPPIINGFHEKEIHIMKLLSSTSFGENIFISGGEDCTLRLSSISNLKSLSSEFKLRTLNILEGHISNVKSIAVLKLEENYVHKKYLIVSGGGRAQLKVWEIILYINDNFVPEDDIHCTELKSYMLLGEDKHRRRTWKDPKKSYNIDPETRFMHINIHQHAQNRDNVMLFIGCSDGYLRIFSYHIVKNCLNLITSVPYHERCILKTHSFMHNEKLIMLSMATDGVVNLWDFTAMAISISECKSQVTDEQICPFANLHLHQSGINSFDLHTTRQNQYILATGGDDNLLNLSYFTLNISDNEMPSIQTIAKWNSNSIHSTQITGVQFYGSNTFFSVGLGRLIAMYNYTYDNECLYVSCVKTIITSVSDVQGMSLCHAMHGQALICVYGKGFELITNEDQNN
ncbi:WD repeat-containing protein 6 isoform X2 [Orussus abietinus]|uniref:WD repeat-containing protein 6 isoform X2 n=1 Tax=Orussus abietinus TaxID=222816 RepID=UPI0006250FE1|nr:WD repeat-containing protein 6 isoform X2 [Orussus abietinus]